MIKGLIDSTFGLLELIWGFICLVFGKNNAAKVVAIFILILIWGGLQRL